MHLEKDRHLSALTSLRIGGRARYYAEPISEDTLIECVHYSRTEGLPLLFLGKGTNVLMSDSGWPGLVVNVSAHYNSLQWMGDEALVESGALLNRLVRESVNRGFGGIEKLSGIPGSVGGAVIMNAGAFRQSFSDVLKEVTYYDCATNSVGCVPVKDMQFGYRESFFQGKKVLVLKATCSFTQGNTQVLSEIASEIHQKRKAKHPLDQPNCGSVFRNPEGGPASAGTLIDSCGLKGMCIGGVQVSEKHANFIVNRGGASADDFCQLVRYIQKSVYDKKGVFLVPEVICIGSFACKPFHDKNEFIT